MITDDEFRNLKYGDEVLISLTDQHYKPNHKYKVNETGFDPKFRIWLKSTGFCKSRTYDGLSVAVLIPNPDIYGWTWQKQITYLSYVQDVEGFDLQELESVKGWWISIHAIDAFRKPTIIPNKETLPLPCVECKQFYPMALPNFEKAKLVCWSCRDSLGWKYEMKDGNVFLKG